VLSKSLKNSTMKVKDLMSVPPITTLKNTSIDDLAGLMYENNIGSVMVVNDKGKLIGIVTERDVIYAVAKGKIGKRFPAYTIMTEDPITISPDAPLFEAAKLMRENKIRHLPVVNREGRPLGMISLRDMLSFIVKLMDLVKGYSSTMP